MLFDRLAIFASSFSLDTATTVCADATLAGDDILELLSALIAQSMIMVDFSRGEARYHMLEANRQFALDKLNERGEREAIAKRHALSCLRVGQRLDRDWYSADERTWFRDANAELDNCRAALGWALVEKQDLQTGCSIAGALARVWYSLAPVEGRNWVRLALASLGEGISAETFALLNIADSELCSALGEYAASFVAAERALNLMASMKCTWRALDRRQASPQGRWDAPRKRRRSCRRRSRIRNVSTFAACRPLCSAISVRCARAAATSRVRA